MTIKKKMLQAAAGNAGEATVDVADVFSTYLYTGTSATHVITNGVDLSGKGGLVWIKTRTNVNASWHGLFDTERGTNKIIYSNTTNGEGTKTLALTSFNSDGFTVDDDDQTNGSNDNYVAWTFRKAPKFFDVVTYTGNGSAPRALSHNLGVRPGMVVIKETSGSGYWWVTHRSAPNQGTAYSDIGGNLYLNFTEAADTGANPTLSAMDDTTFTLSTNKNTTLNGSGETFVAYLFAHDTEDDSMIKCGSYTGNGGTDNPVTLGWEPQYVMIKNTASALDWIVFDTMRGLVTGGADARLHPNSTAFEESDGTSKIEATATGFSLKINSGFVNSPGVEYVYMAIRGPMTKEPESATEVFAVDTKGTTTPAYISNFPVDMYISGYAYGDNHQVRDRLRGGSYLFTTVTNTEGPASSNKFPYMDGVEPASTVHLKYLAYMWKRAKGYFDVVAYSGNSVAGRTVSHSLGVVPEMIWVKARTVGDNWIVYHNTLGPTKHARLNTDQQPFTSTPAFNNTAPTDSVFTLGTELATNYSGQDYIAYLFATLAGISKVGSYTGNGSSQTIDCGFTSGARFILIKRTNSAGDWYVWDSLRGIVAGNDSHLSLNTTAAQVTTDDSVDPASSGFIVNQVSATNINVSAASYIFYAIA